MSQLLSSEGVNSDEISMGTSNSSEMNLENNDEADHQLRNLITQQTVVQMQEHSFKNLKGEFAFWDKNPNRSTQPDTLKKTSYSFGRCVVPISRIEPERVFSVTDSFVTETRARLGDDSVDYKRLVQKNVEFV